MQGVHKILKKHNKLFSYSPCPLSRPCSILQCHVTADPLSCVLLPSFLFSTFSTQGVHKILKKHDKLLPHSPCRQFYIAHLHQQPWVQGTYSDVLVQLSNVYSQLRGDASGQKNEDSAQVGLCVWGGGGRAVTGGWALEQRKEG
jgi:SPX domain protein involved in polyphosphate accumulation